MQEGPATIVVQVQSNASKNSLTRFEDGFLYLKIAAPPVKGKANHELVRFLSDVFCVPRSNLTISGRTSKRKVILIEGMTQTQVTEKLLSLLC